MASGTYERRFVQIFNDTDHWFAQRAAASGSAPADLPDVTIGHDGIAFAGEMKSSSEACIYLEPEEAEALKRYARAFGMHPVAIGRFKRGSPSIKGTDRHPKAYYIWNLEDMGTSSRSDNLRGDPRADNWAARIAHPEADADGIHPEHLSGFHLRHGVKGELGKGITAPPADSAALPEGA